MENFRSGTNFEIRINLFKFRKKNSEKRRKENKIKATLPGPAIRWSGACGTESLPQ
jgi:hypothetical protein